MFSGIVEACSRAARVEEADHQLVLVVPRPPGFSDVKVGDSIAINGVCLTVESVDHSELRFTIGPETLAITGWSAAVLRHLPLNLERALALGDRIHGHMVSGHVDGRATVVAMETLGDCRILTLGFDARLRPYIWPKGSIAINGVSLTINAVRGDSMSVCLIPETLRRTNLRDLLIGDVITVEVDSYARAMVHWLDSQGKLTWN